jgi:hypothetical protein
VEKDLVSKYLATGLPVHHIAVVDAALPQVPHTHRHGTQIIASGRIGERQ